MGAIILPKISPNLIHALFKGVSIFELSRPNIKNTKDRINAQDLISFPCNNGHNETINNTIKKTIPKLLLELLASIL